MIVKTSPINRFAVPLQGLLQRRPADRVQADVQGGLRLGALAEEVLQAEHAQVEG